MGKHFETLTGMLCFALPPLPWVLLLPARRDVSHSLQDQTQGLQTLDLKAGQAEAREMSVPTSIALRHRGRGRGGESRGPQGGEQGAPAPPPAHAICPECRTATASFRSSTCRPPQILQRDARLCLKTLPLVSSHVDNSVE